jgi:hypothetical protein
VGIEWLHQAAVRYVLLGLALWWLGISTFRLIFHEDLFGRHGDHVLDALGCMMLVGVLAVVFWWYRIRDYDLGALLLGALCGATLVVIALGRSILDSSVDQAAAWLVMALMTLGIYGGAAFGLQKVHQAQRIPAS